MLNLFTVWVEKNLRIESFKTRRDSARLAIKLAALAVVIRAVLNFLVFTLVHNGELLPASVVQSLILGFAFGSLLTVIIAFVVGYTLGEAIRSLSISRAKFEQLSRTDMLTGLLNRRAFAEVFQTTGQGTSLVIFDIDRFKGINDRFGHAVGDNVIFEVARTLAAELGKERVYRMGGEEFTALLPTQNAEALLAHVDAVRSAIAARMIASEDGDIRVTVSAGIADIDPHRSHDAIYRDADKALYLAKAAGRNRSVHQQSVGTLFPEQNELPLMPASETPSGWRFVA